MIIVVSCVILNNNKVLMVQEGKNHIYGLWNLPSGRLENNEKIVDAVIREVEEETGYKVTVSGLTGIYNFFSETNTQVILFNFIGEVVGGDLQYDHEEIINVKWLSMEEISELKDDELRNCRLIRNIINDVRDKCIVPLDIINDLI
ncbi:MAG: NUDIX domain-containing protein [Bacillota bacterium]